MYFPTLLLALVALVALSDATHTSNWAVLVSTSRFWFNYRHLANVLSLYRTVKRLGIPDSQIILMLPDDMACNPRNSFPGSVFNDKSRELDVYDDNGETSSQEQSSEGIDAMGGIEVDYRGTEVTVESFIRLLTDRWPASHPTSKRLLTDDRSNILIYMTGHGGNEFLKFQDSEEISSFDLADAFEQMWEKKRYHEMLFMIDTCQANTMYPAFYTPNIIATGSSAKDQSSYSHHADQDVGVAVVDRWTYFNLDFLETRLNSTSSDVRLGELFDYMTPERVHSDAGVRYDLFPGGEAAARDRRILDFFGNVQGVEVDGDASDVAGQEHDDQAARRQAWQRDLDGLRMLVENTQAMQENETARARSPKAKFEQHAVEDSATTIDSVGTSAWLKKAVGITSLLGLGTAWYMVQ